jgi:hypothetical protein
MFDAVSRAPNLTQFVGVVTAVTMLVMKVVMAVLAKVSE